ncbi:hypothetical protein GCM10023321_81250 [Pseudonocardia eucalypti]|uniref:Uncharacterized protein n=1 Tax=Pseudonocardia eucalypti TaxID=648755 RepID=A0ABP9RDV0_9PSEU
MAGPVVLPGAGCGARPSGHCVAHGFPDESVGVAEVVTAAAAGARGTPHSSKQVTPGWPLASSAVVPEFALTG